MATEFATTTAMATVARVAAPWKELATDAASSLEDLFHVLTNSEAVARVAAPFDELGRDAAEFLDSHRRSLMQLQFGSLSRCVEFGNLLSRVEAEAVESTQEDKDNDSKIEVLPMALIALAVPKMSVPGVLLCGVSMPVSAACWVCGGMMAVGAISAYKLAIENSSAGGPSGPIELMTTAALSATSLSYTNMAIFGDLPFPDFTLRHVGNIFSIPILIYNWGYLAGKTSDDVAPILILSSGASLLAMFQTTPALFLSGCCLALIGHQMIETPQACFIGSRKVLKDAGIVLLGGQAVCLIWELLAPLAYVDPAADVIVYACVDTASKLYASYIMTSNPGQMQTRATTFHAIRAEGQTLVTEVREECTQS